MKATVVSCCEKKFKDKETNKERIYYAVYIADQRGAVGMLYSNSLYKSGDSVNLEISIGKDMRVGVRIAA